MGVLDVIKAPFNWVNKQYDNAAFGQGWEQKVNDESMARKLTQIHQANELRRQTQTYANADTDQRIQNMKTLTPYLEGQLYTNPDAQITPVDMPMPEGVTFEQLLNSVRGNARAKGVKEQGAVIRNKGAEQSQVFAGNRDDRATADEARKAGREPLVEQNIRSQIDVREHPRQRPTAPKPAKDTEATFQRDFTTARSMLNEAYKAGERDTPASEADVSNLAQQIRDRRRGQMGSTATTPTPAPTPSTGAKMYKFQGQLVPFDQLPIGMQMEVKKRGL